MTNKDLYKIICNQNNISIFSQYWWLDAVVGENNWEVIIIKDKEKIVGAFPYTVRKIYNIFKGIYNPNFSHRSELFLNYPENLSSLDKISFENEIIEKIIDKIPKTALFSVNFNYKFTNWLSFYWKNYNSSVKYSYTVDTNAEPDIIFNNFHNRTKRFIKKSEKIYQITESEDIKLFYELNLKTLERKKIKAPFTFEKLERIDNVCKQNDCKKILLAYIENKPVAGVLLVWDKEYLYYLSAGVIPEAKSTGVSSLLVWESIKIAKLLNKTFDFEGSMNKNIENFFRSFNAKQQIYLNINKINNPILRILKAFI